MPRTSAKARRAALAARIARQLFTSGFGAHARIADRIVLVQGRIGEERELSGWCEGAIRDVIEAHLRPGQRRRADRPRP